MSRAFMIKQASFKPTDIGGCQLWLDASDTATISLSGSTVTQINDKSGNSNNTSSSTGTVTYAAGGLNSRPAFSFNATGGFRGPTSITGTTLTAFTVATLNSGVNYNGRLLGLANATQSDYQYATTGQPFFCLNGGPNISGYRNNTYMSYQINTFNTPFIGTSQFTGSSNITSINGTPGTAVADANGSFSITKYGFGCEGLSDAGVNWYGYCSEMILYNSLLSTAQRQQVEAYLAQKWGLRQQLSPGHPGTTAIVYSSQPIPTAIYWRYPTAFVPTSIGNCQLWLDASDTTKIGPSGGGTLTSWTDKSGTGKTVTIVNAPSYSTTGFNTSYPCVTFTTANSLTISITAPGTTDIAMFAVWMCTTSSTPNPPNNSDVLSIGGPASGNETAIGWNSLSTAYVLYTYNVGGSVSPTNIGLNIPLVESGIQLSGTQYVYVNGYDPASTGGSVYNQTNTTVYIGGGSAFRLQGQVAEVLYYNSTFTTLQRQQIEGYLAWKWGLQGSLPANHPYKNSSPSTTNPAGISRPANVLPIPPITLYASTKPPAIMATALSYLPLLANSTDIGTSPQTITTNGTVTYTTFAGKQTAYFTNNPNNYLSFPYVNQTNFTLSYWINPADTGYYTSVSITTSGLNPALQSDLTGSSASITIYTAMPNQWSNQPTGTINAVGAWTHIAITINQTTFVEQLYINGTLAATATGSGTGISSRNLFFIGRSGDTGPRSATGYVRQFCFFPSVLTQAQVQVVQTYTA